jgi:hypothetical protein
MKENQMGVKLSKGVNYFESTRIGNQSLSGMTISEVMNNTLLKRQLGLTGNEAVEVSQNGGDFVAVDSYYVLEDGDEVMFTQSGGEKGV